MICCPEQEPVARGYCPTPEQIAEACRVIQSEWTPGERYSRHRGHDLNDMIETFARVREMEPEADARLLKNNRRRKDRRFKANRLAEELVESC